EMPAPAWVAVLPPSGDARTGSIAEAPVVALDLPAACPVVDPAALAVAVDCADAWCDRELHLTDRCTLELSLAPCGLGRLVVPLSPDGSIACASSDVIPRCEGVAPSATATVARAFECPYAGHSDPCRVELLN